jgi:cation diffusion facilitator CzcD-associated flavoprotein CzcO
LHRGLKTNVPRTLITFKDFPYPDNVSLLLTDDKIKQYLEDYSNDISNCIQLNSEVTKVTERFQAKWKVDVANTVKGTKVTSIYFDAVIVAAGTFNEYNFPYDLDLEFWEKVNPGTIIHSRDFREETSRKR